MSRIAYLRRGRLLIECLMAFVVLAIVPRLGGAQLPAIALGVLLNQLADKVSGLIQQAQNAGSMLEVGAGGEIMLAITNARLAYRDELQRTANTLDSERQQSISDIQSAVTALEKHAY